MSDDEQFLDLDAIALRDAARDAHEKALRAWTVATYAVEKAAGRARRAEAAERAAWAAYSKADYDAIKARREAGRA